VERADSGAWKAWRSDPATGMYGPAEVQLALDLAYVYEQWVQDGTLLWRLSCVSVRMGWGCRRRASRIVGGGSLPVVEDELVRPVARFARLRAV
jgi:hypothetical protein